MKSSIVASVAITLLLGAPAWATGSHTCDSGPRSGWVSRETLAENLTAQGWQVRRIKEDGGCWEVYAINPEDRKVEAYFHPVTHELEASEED